MNVSQTFAATHTTPVEGLDFWQAPDVTKRPDGRLAPAVEVQVLERVPSGWARVLRASGGWPVWVDGRRLDEPARRGATTGAELLARITTALETYQRLLDDFGAHRIDFDAFRRQAFRAGLIMRDDSALLLDLPSGTWYRYDGVQLYAQGRAFQPPKTERSSSGPSEG
ncbi:hypothetical protein [Streptomyces klenkii]|uniref:hypothetical protein n=1 Tax=Streptomyces klenkii TaxID=1420899 RepID=UPI00343B1337